MKFVKAMDGFHWVVKLVLCLPLLNITWGLYRIIKGYSKNNTLMLVVGVLWIIPGAFFCWMIDLGSTILYNEPKFMT